MPRYNTPAAKPAVQSPVTTTGQSGTTYEGAPGYERDVKSALFLLAVAHLGDGSFYEKKAERDERFRGLIRTVAAEEDGPEWLGKFVLWLRGTANMRTASVVVAAETAKAFLDAGRPGGRQLIASALQRSDEPGELIAYWASRHGRNIPMPVKRGTADAAKRLYSEYALLKYDTASHGYRFADVIELCHPKAREPWRDQLFRTALDRRHGHEDQFPEALPMMIANRALRSAAAEDPQVLLDTDALARAGMTWEDVLSLAGDRVPKKDLWTALIPVMGYMALLRNLRNFDDAGIPDELAAEVAARLSDPDQVARSRQFPFRFLSAYKAAPSLRWAYPLEKALNLSLVNVPRLKGSTLILVDRSGSMFGKVSEKSGLSQADTAALFGTALAIASEKADLVQFGTDSETVPFRGSSSVLAVIGSFTEMGGTYTAAAVQAHYRGHDRVVILTDEQAWYPGDPADLVPAGIPVYTWNLAGYARGHAPSGTGNRHTFGGLTDNSFRLIQLLEAGRSADWDDLFG